MSEHISNSMTLDRIHSQALHSSTPSFSSAVSIQASVHHSLSQILPLPNVSILLCVAHLVISHPIPIDSATISLIGSSLDPSTFSAREQLKNSPSNCAIDLDLLLM
jgi:hypothetical protein